MPVLVCSGACGGDDDTVPRGKQTVAKLLIAMTPMKASKIRRKRKRNTVGEDSLCRMKPCAIYSRGMQASTWKVSTDAMRKLGLSTLLLLLLMTPSARSQKTSTTKARSSSLVQQPVQPPSRRECHMGGIHAEENDAARKARPDADALLFRRVHFHRKRRIQEICCIKWKKTTSADSSSAPTRGPLGIERSQVYPTAVLTNELQRRAKIPLLIGADFEAGTGMRLDEGTSFPSAMAIAATGDPKLAYTVGKVDRARSARRRRALDLRARCGREQQSR